MIRKTILVVLSICAIMSCAGFAMSHVGEYFDIFKVRCGAT